MPKDVKYFSIVYWNSQFIPLERVRYKVLASVNNISSSIKDDGIFLPSGAFDTVLLCVDDTLYRHRIGKALSNTKRITNDTQTELPAEIINIIKDLKNIQ